MMAVVYPSLPLSDGLDEFVDGTPPWCAHIYPLQNTCEDAISEIHCYPAPPVKIRKFALNHPGLRLSRSPGECDLSQNGYGSIVSTHSLAGVIHVLKPIPDQVLESMPEKYWRQSQNQCYFPFPGGCLKNYPPRARMGAHVSAETGPIICRPRPFRFPFPSHHIRSWLP